MLEKHDPLGWFSEFFSVSIDFLSLAVVLYLSEYLVARQTLEYAYNQGMTQGDYAFVMLQLDLERFKRNMDKPGQIYVLMDLDKDKTCDYYQALESVVLVEVQSKLPDEKKSYEAFEKKVKEKYDSFKTNLTASIETAGFKVSFIVNELGGVGVGDMGGENCI